MARRRGDHQIRAMKNLDLSDAETAGLIDLLKRAIVADRYPLSPRVLTLVGILGKLRPEPDRPAASPPPRVYAPRREGGIGDAAR
jgi:hypothetical protein